MDNEIKNSIMKTGTTILGIVCKDGIVMAGDRRGTVGNIIYEKNAEKAEILNDYLAYAGCGFSTEIQKVSKLLKAELRIKELKSRSRPTVRQAASLLSNIKVSGSAFILGGFDKDGTFSLYDVLGGYLSKIEEFTASAGSGMPFVLGFLEREYKKGITVKEGIELAKDSLKSSMKRDSASGNGIDIITITKDGVKKVVEQEILPEYKDREKEK